MPQITSYAARTTPDFDDTFYGVSDPGGTPADFKVEWSDLLKFAGARVTRSTAQSIPDATVTTVNWDAETFDSDAFHDNATNNSRLTIPAGWPDCFVICTAGLSFASSTGGYRRYGSITRNGLTAADQGHTHQSPLTDTGAKILNWSTGPIAASAGDFFEVECLQDSGGNLNVLQLDANSFFSIVRVGFA